MLCAGLYATAVKGSKRWSSSKVPPRNTFGIIAVCVQHLSHELFSFILITQLLHLTYSETKLIRICCARYMQVHGFNNTWYYYSHVSGLGDHRTVPCLECLVCLSHLLCRNVSTCSRYMLSREHAAHLDAKACHRSHGSRDSASQFCLDIICQTAGTGHQ